MKYLHLFVPGSSCGWERHEPGAGACKEGTVAEDGSMKHTKTQGHTGSNTQRHTDTRTHRHKDTKAHRHKYTKTQRYTDTNTQRYSDTQVQIHKYTKTLRHTYTQTLEQRHADIGAGNEVLVGDDGSNKHKTHRDTQTQRHTDA